jgi:hypothetical protein
MRFEAFRRLSTLSLFASLVHACGGGSEAPAPKLASDAVQVDSDDHLHGVSTSAEIGGLNEDEVEAVFKGALGALGKCLDSGSERLEFLGGKVSFSIKIDRSGKASHIHLEQSTLGDRDTEKCMISALRSRSWPKPVGGDVGLAKKSFDFDPPNDVRPPTDWDPENIEKGLEKLGDKIAECKSQSSGDFEATAYVSTEGTVMAASVTPPDEAGESAVDCLVETLRAGSFPSPGSWPAKVTFRL